MPGPRLDRPGPACPRGSHGANAARPSACAAAAAAVLASGGHENTAYDITGPEAVDADGLAALAAEIGGKPVEVVRVDD